jgi:hypothetical protein
MLFEGATAVPPRWLPAVFVVGSLLPFWESWQVLRAESIAAVSCSGLFSGTGCFIGNLIGKVVFQESSQYLGFVLFSASLGALVLYLAYKLYKRRQQLISSEA